MNLLNDIFTYAFRGSGKYVFITCVVLSVVAKLAGIAPLVGPVAALLLAFYFCAIYFQLIQSSAIGGREAPEFPDISNLFEDMVWPSIQVMLVATISFGPLIGYSIWAGDHHSSPVIGFGLLAFGIIYFPMAMLAVAVLGYTGALGPQIVIPAIFRAGWLYWLGVAMLCALYFAASAIGDFMAGNIILEALADSIVGAYTLMTNARILGVVYRERTEELGWL